MDDLENYGLYKKKLFIEHAIGHVHLGKPYIIIAVSSKCGAESYQLSKYPIEQIKIRASIWKEEYKKKV